MKVVVTIPSYTGRIRHDMVLELLDASSRAAGLIHNVLIAAECSVLPVARAALLGTAVADGADVVICLDDDTILGRGALFTLMANWEELRETTPGAVGMSAIVPRRDGTWPAPHTRELFAEVEAFGLAATVLDGHALRKVWEAAPVVVYDGSTYRMLTPFEVKDGVFVGEDHALCAQLRQHGTLHYATSVAFEHAGRR